MKDDRTILSPLQRLLGEDFNPALLVIMVRKSLLWCILIMLVTISAALLYLRYTLPTYEVNAALIVKPINTAQALDIQNNLFQTKSTDLDLQKDIQLMKSNVILDRVIDSLNLQVGYFLAGKILHEELYKNHPFTITLSNVNDDMYDRPIRFRILSDQKYQIDFSAEGSGAWKTFEFNKEYTTSSLTFQTTLNSSYYARDPSGASEYFFIIHSPASLYASLRSALLIAPSAPTVGLVMRDLKAQKAADIVNAVADEFIKYDKEKKTESATLILKFIEAQVDSISNDLHNYEDQMTSFKLANGVAISSMEEEINTELKDLKKQQEELNIELSTLEYYRKFFLQYQDSSRLLFGIIDDQHSGLSDNIQALDHLQSQYKELSLRLTPNNPEILNLQQQITDMKHNILSSILNAEDKVNEKQKQVESETNQYLAQFASVPGIQSEYLKLSRLSDLKEKYYLLLLDKKSAFSITKAGFVSDYTILRKAEPTTIPVSPNSPLIKLLGIVIGVILCIMVIVIRYLLHHKILSVSEIARYCDAGILGVIPKYHHPMDVSQLVVNKSPKSVISECFRSMRTNLEYISPNKAPRLITTTSTVAGEGKTFISVNMAGILAVAGKKVVLIDFDLRKPQLHKAFSVENQRGISTLLIGKYTLQDCIRHSEWENLDFITSGPLPPNPAEFIDSKKTDELLAQLMELYDVVVIDTPPVGIVTDALELIKRADVPIYVMRADYSSRNFLNNINHLYHNLGIQRLSVVLNDMGEGASAYSYNYGYSYGYGYGYGYRGYGYNQIGGQYYTDDLPGKKGIFRKIANFMRSLF